MAKALYYPAANRTAQDFSKAYPGVIFTSLRLLCLHTTEGGGWPSYDGGAKAPTLTALPDYTNKKLLWRQHFPLNMSARALRNPSGGVNTNTTNIVQIELVGTSEKGGPGMYWPEAPDWALQDLAKFVQFLEAEWSVPIQSSVKWVAYPASYGLNASQRLSGSAWMAYKGILGHEHVPENDHGDPGLFPIGRFLNFAKEDDLALSADDKTWLTTLVTSKVDARLDATDKYLDSRVRAYFGDKWVQNPPMAVPVGTLKPDANGSVLTSPLGMINEVFYKVDTEVSSLAKDVAAVKATQANVMENLVNVQKTLASFDTSNLVEIKEHLALLVEALHRLSPTQPTT